MKLRAGFRFLVLLFTLYSLLITVNSCGPTYPKEKIKESVIKVCRNEYDLDVKVETSGKTIAIYLPLTDLIDFTFALTKSASDKINDVLLSVSRVTLSTDAKFDYYCVIAHDVRIPELQIIIIKSVEDVKRLFVSDISRGEYLKRMLIDLRLSPQSQKERAVKEILGKMNLDERWQEEMMNDFFRSEPTALSDIGYWNGRFYIKDITKAEFLSEQLANRLKLVFREDKTLSDDFTIKFAKGTYISKEKERFFKFTISTKPKSGVLAEADDSFGKIFGPCLKEISNVLHGYGFTDFDHVEILNEGDGRMLKVSRDELEGFRKKKIKLENIVSKMQNYNEISIPITR